jgi:hypothetical protein
MDRGRVGEDRGSKETDGCPLTKGTPHKANANVSVDEYMVYHFYSLLNDFPCTYSS